MTLDEYVFPHAVCLLEGHLKSEMLALTYSKCYTHLDLDNHPEVGITIVVTPKWMFVATLTGPYAWYKQMPVYIDGYAYTGIMNVQITEKEWPATAGIDQIELTPMDILEKSSCFND